MEYSGVWRFQHVSFGLGASISPEGSGFKFTDIRMELLEHKDTNPKSKEKSFEYHVETRL